MAKGTVEKRELTEEELADAMRLKAAWERRKADHKHMTQKWMAEQTKLGNQSLVNQYLNGVIPLNPTAVMAFANVLDIHPSSISPRMPFPRPLQDEYASLSRQALEVAKAFDLLPISERPVIQRALGGAAHSRVTAEELELISLFHGVGDETRGLMLASMRVLASGNTNSAGETTSAPDDLAEVIRVFCQTDKTGRLSIMSSLAGIKAGRRPPAPTPSSSNNGKLQNGGGN